MYVPPCMHLPALHPVPRCVILVGRRSVLAIAEAFEAVAAQQTVNTRRGCMTRDWMVVCPYRSDEA
jgi:hypothetical protein